MKHGVLFNSSVSMTSAERLVDGVLDKMEDMDELHLFIHSPGGNVSQALCLARFLQSLPYQITTYNLAGVDSAAILLFAAGDVRIAAPQSSFYFHEISLELQGNVTIRDLTCYLNELNGDVRNMTTYLAERTGRSAAMWRNLMQRNALVSAQQAHRNGLASRIDVPRDIQAVYHAAIAVDTPHTPLQRNAIINNQHKSRQE